MTLRWSCRCGDFIFWFSWKNLFADPEHGLAINDVWEMRDGDFVSITNRIEDIPEWFHLHPTEVCNSLANRMLEKLQKGYKPEDPLDGPNIWRPKSGDRMAWVGKPRSGIPAKGPVLSIIDFMDCALVLGENNQNPSFEEFIAFGSLSKSQPTPEEVAMSQEAVRLVNRVGHPRNILLSRG